MSLRLPVIALLCLPLVVAADRGRYLIELESPPAAERAGREEPRRRTAVMERQRAAVQDEQDRLRRFLERYAAEEIHSLDTLVNGIVVRTDDATSRRIARLPGVRSVTRMGTAGLALDESARLLNIDDAYAWVGSETAGLGAKIAILDTGIDTTHPAFRDSSLPMPPGFPRGNSADDVAQTNSKVIVYRTYDTLDEELTALVGARDCDGHGTGVAMCAGGAPVPAPLATFSGVAPKAYLGAYKVFPGCRENAPSDIILKAIEDAVRDGMDVINLSIGGTAGAGPENDLYDAAVTRAAALGSLVVFSAGNNGPAPATVNDWGRNGPAALSVGGSNNARVVVSNAIVGGKLYDAIPGDGPTPPAPVTGELFDVSRLAANGLACDALPAGSLTGRIALIERGGCGFKDKLEHAAGAGAAAALLYTDNRDFILMGQGGVTLPAMMVTREDGLAIKAAIPQNGTLPATLDFQTVRRRPIPENRLYEYSSRGPGPRHLIKPDLLATGANVYTASSTQVPPPPRLYGTFSGTSFASPITAGAAAVVKQARPGLNVRQIISLLVNTAAPMSGDSGALYGVQVQGAGRLDLQKALVTNVTADPRSVSFGRSGANVNLERRILLTNIGIYPDTFTLAVEPFAAGPSPSVTPGAVTLARGQSAFVTLRFNASGLAPGEYQGYLWARGTRPGSEIHLAYWLGVGDGVAWYLRRLDDEDEAGAKAGARYTIHLRLVDRWGISITDPLPVVTVVNGGGKVIRVFAMQDVWPESVGIEVETGPQPGENVFHVQLGEFGSDVTVQAAAP